MLIQPTVRPIINHPLAASLATINIRRNVHGTSLGIVGAMHKRKYRVVVLNATAAGDLMDVALGLAKVGITQSVGVAAEIKVNAAVVKEMGQPLLLGGKKKLLAMVANDKQRLALVDAVKQSGLLMFRDVQPVVVGRVTGGQAGVQDNQFKPIEGIMHMGCGDLLRRKALLNRVS